MGSKKKSLMKTITWRPIAISIHLSVAYLFTKSVTDALGLVLAANLFSMLVYYVHERMWEKYYEKNEDKKGSKKTSILKTISWRLIAITIGLATAFYYTKSAIDSVELIVMAQIASTILYYCHERVWEWYEKKKLKHQLFLLLIRLKIRRGKKRA